MVVQMGSQLHSVDQSGFIIDGMKSEYWICMWCNHCLNEAYLGLMVDLVTIIIIV